MPHPVCQMRCSPVRIEGVLHGEHGHTGTTEFIGTI